ncbi:MAG: hypothetical protein KDJ99_03555 [Candidatus Competibacteraceae bacterium]|nr:hypothetical protein [Candidatus Competibacteraceae bacterium]
MTTFIKQLMVGALVSLLPMTLWANSFVYNTTDRKVDVVWTAAGCAGLEYVGCKSAQAKKDVPWACQKKTLSPGEGAGYTFKGGTSDRRVTGYVCSDGETVSNGALTGNKGKKSRCVARINNDIGIKCGYNQSEFDEIKGK